MLPALALGELEVIQDDGRHSAAMNMAIDEALLERATTPTLRFYSWRSPALSFGYFGRYADAAANATKRELVRRWTGGGIVLHGADLTYSLVVPRAAMPFPVSARAVYLFVHSAIFRALRGTAEATLSAADAPRNSDLCFANPVIADVLVAGTKIAGAAQRRTRRGWLQQGSIQYEKLPHEFAGRLASELCSSFSSLEMAGSTVARAGELAATKYGTRVWLERYG